jgi:hypothetical protein
MSDAVPALTVLQPWAHLVASGIKTIETRTWATSYRGPLLIHAGQRVLEDVCATKGISSAGLDRGAIIAVTELYKVRPMLSSDEAAACCPIYDGAYSWVLRNTRVIPPIPVRGLQRLWAPPQSVLDALQRLGAQPALGSGPAAGSSPTGHAS